MRLLATQGALPASIVENTAPWEWAGTLLLLHDPREVLFLEVAGFAGNFFDAILNQATGVITVMPIARLDHEWFTRAGLTPVVDISLRFFMTDGTVAQSATTHSVVVEDIDDTPPQSLRFASGGSVRAGEAGAVIGRLAVEDPDTQGGFTFHLLEGDAWQFEVVDKELRLRPGVSLDLADGPQRQLMVEVSDGTQSAAFALSIEVLPAPTVSERPISVLVPGMQKLGLAWTAPQGVGGLLPSWEVAEVGLGGGMVRIKALNGQDVWFDRPGWIDLTNGYIEFSAHGEAARVWLAYQTIFDRAPRLNETKSVVHDMLTRGLTEDYLLHWMIHLSAEGRPLSALNTRDFVREIYGNVVNWTIADSTISWHANRIDAGIVTRAQFVKGIMEWRTQFSDFTTEVAGGFFVPRMHLTEIGALYRASADSPLWPEVWWWYYMIDRGAVTLRELARDLSGTSAFQGKFGAMDNAGFVQAFFREMTDLDFPASETAWWARMLDNGSLARADFMAAVAANIPASSSFRMLPEGPMFDAIW